MAEPTALVSDDDLNPLRLVLGTPDAVQRFSSKIKAQKKKWPLRPADRMDLMARLALDELDRLNIPHPVRMGARFDMGGFERSTWSIYLKKDIFIDSEWEDIAIQAGHVFHEFEHLASTYVAAQSMAAAGASAEEIAKTLGILRSIADEAKKNPLPAADKALMSLGKTCLSRVTEDKPGSSKESYYERLQASIKKVRGDIKVSEDRLLQMEKGKGPFPRDLYSSTYADKRRLDKELQHLNREYSMTSVEIGSTVTENLVKSSILRDAAAAHP